MKNKISREELKSLIREIIKETRGQVNEEETNEGKLRNLAAAGMVGWAALHPAQAKQALRQAQQFAQQAITPRHISVNDPNQELPSEKDSTPWDLADKYSNQPPLQLEKTKKNIKT